MANEIVWFNSTETGAPTLNNAAGSLDAVLYACLVTGFRTITLDSIVVAGEVATATNSAGHGYGDQRMVDIAGASTSAVNGRKLITVTGASTFTFPVPGVIDGPVSGTKTARRSPLGWTRPLSSGNVSMYQRTDVTATGMCLRVDDSGSGAASATAARWRMVESFTDLATFTGSTPPASAYGGAGVFIPKGANSAAAKGWVLVGDSRGFYMFTEASSWPASSYSGVPQGIWAFGDLESYRAGDSFACLMAGADDSTGASASSLGNVYSPSASTPSQPQTMLARPFNGIGQPVFAQAVGLGSGNRRIGSSGQAYPSPVDNGLLISTPLHVSEANSAFGHPLRGQLRGVGDPVATVPGGLLHLQVLDNLVGSDRRWLLVGFQQQGSYGHAAFDITGPW